jgi:hypothetical protein
VIGLIDITYPVGSGTSPTNATKESFCLNFRRIEAGECSGCLKRSNATSGQKFIVDIKNQLSRGSFGRKLTILLSGVNPQHLTTVISPAKEPFKR